MLIIVMIVPMLGSVGIGLVWGWLVGSLDGRVRQPYLTVTMVGFATFVISVVILWFLDWRGLAFFLGAALITYLLHVGWQRELRHRFR